MRCRLAPRAVKVSSEAAAEVRSASSGASGRRRAYAWAFSHISALLWRPTATAQDTDSWHQAGCWGHESGVHLPVLLVATAKQLAHLAGRRAAVQALQHAPHILAAGPERKHSSVKSMPVLAQPGCPCCPGFLCLKAIC